MNVRFQHGGLTIMEWDDATHIPRAGDAVSDDKLRMWKVDTGPGYWAGKGAVTLKIHPMFEER